MIFQLGSALLDACVLSVLSGEDAYGYILTQRVKEGIEISESTLYPVLRRLQKDGCLAVYDQPFQGRNRRYYTITPKGVELLEEYRQGWEEYRERINRILFPQTEAETQGGELPETEEERNGER